MFVGFCRLQSVFLGVFTCGLFPTFVLMNDAEEKISRQLGSLWNAVARVECGLTPQFFHLSKGACESTPLDELILNTIAWLK